MCPAGTGRGEKQGLSQEEIDRQLTDRKSVNANIYTNWAHILPLTEMPHFKGVFDTYYEWLEHPPHSKYRKKTNGTSQANNIRVPIFVLNGWRDLFSEGSVNLYQALIESDTPQSVKDGSRLRMVTYSHSFDQGTPSFGPNSKVSRDPEALEIPFFDKHLKGIDAGFDATKPVEITVMTPSEGENAGYTFRILADTYPLPHTSFVSLFLASDGDANTRFGGGELWFEAVKTPNGSITDQFIYSPMDPVPTISTHSCCSNEKIPNGYKNGMLDQAEIEQRDDVLVYTSAPLDEPIVVVGSVEVRLFAKSSARDTDFTAKLVDVRPNGATNNIVDGVVRASLRKGHQSKPSPINPGRTYEYKIPLGPTAYVFPAGHRIRLQISSSNFPKLACNLNTGNSNEKTAETIIAEQTVLHDAQHPSQLILPIVSGVIIPSKESAILTSGNTR